MNNKKSLLVVIGRRVYQLRRQWPFETITESSVFIPRTKETRLTKRYIEAHALFAPRPWCEGSPISKFPDYLFFHAEDNTHDLFDEY